MEQIELNLDVVNEFLDLKNFFEKVGFELVGVRNVNDESIYFVRKRKK